MNYKGIIITGTSGSGKSTVVKELCSRDPRFVHVKAITTRARRADDTPGTYDYISEKNFQSLKARGKFLVYADYRGYHYGIRHSDFDALKRAGKIPILTITPESAVRLDSTKRANTEGSPGRVPRFLSFFIDAPDNVLNNRLKIRGNGGKEALVLEPKRGTDRRYKDSLLYQIENLQLRSSVDFILSLWDNSNIGGVLPARLIHLAMACGTLLKEGNPENISGASYDLTLGDEYFYGGRIHRLTHENPFLLIEPYDYALVTTQEVCDFPMDVCARFDLSVSLFCQGIILSNGTQVDPGFKGRLLCLLFNTSNSLVLLRRRQHYTTLEFHKLVEPTYPYAGPYKGKDLLYYLPDNAARGAINELKKELEQLRKESRNLQTRMWAVLSFILALLALWVSLR